MDVKKLIHEVYAKQPIWDLKNGLHHNRELIYKYWKEIAKNCNTTTQYAKTKWKNLRDSFRTEYKKVVKGRAKDTSGNYEITSNWVWYKELSFLEGQMLLRKRNVYLPPAISPTTDMNEDEEDSTVEYNIIKTETTVSEVSKEEIEDESQQEETFYETISSSQNVNRKRDQSDIDVTPNTNKRMRFDETNFSNSLRNDDCYHFLMSLHKPLNSFSVEKQMFIRFKIQELIYNEMSKSSDGMNNF